MAYLLATLSLVSLPLAIVLAILLYACNTSSFRRTELLAFGVLKKTHLKCSADVKGSAINQSAMVLVEAQLRSGLQRDVQVTAYYKGKRVVNIWGGDASVEETSLFMPFSVCKGVAATAVALCVESGQLDYEESVSSYWPGFAQGGKGGVTVEEAISHRAGIYPNSIAPLFQCWFADWTSKWSAGLSWVEQCSPATTDTDAPHAQYHMVSFSWIVGGIVEAATGRHITSVVADLAQRLGEWDPSAVIGLDLYIY
jgi:CubicO group peptidase (beta-lactamase class C family)